MIEAIKRRLLELLTDRADGRMSHTKIGFMIAGATFTYKMLVDRPADATLWLVYMGTVGGYAVAKQFINTRYGSAPTEQKQ